MKCQEKNYLLISDKSEIIAKVIAGHLN